MTPRLSPALAAFLFLLAAPAPHAADNLVAPAPLGDPATTVYRQVTPDGRIIYSDKAIKGARVDQTLHIDTPPKGTQWVTESGPRPAIPPQTERTEVSRVNAIPQSGQRRTADDATSDVIRAEMLLEDAKERLQAGVEPLPGERTGNVGGGSRLNPVYDARQKKLAQEVADAEARLKKAIAERDSLRP